MGNSVGQNIKLRIRKIVLDILLKLNMRKNNYPIILNFNLDESKEQKRVLLCYLDYVSSNIRMFRNATHTNFAELNVLIKALIGMNAVIDVCSFEAEGIDAIIKDREYDYIIGFGAVFRKAVEYHPNAKKILYVTENPYHISEKAEMERINYFQERTGYQEKLFRTGKSYLNNDLFLADSIICLGEPRHMEHLGIPVYHVTPTGFRNEKFEFSWEKKNKKKFLVFGSNGIIHKGIDLLIEVFRNNEQWEVYICGAGTEEALKKTHINNIPSNVHLCGYVSTQSEYFMELLEQCVFALLPSCSEACATSLLTCMRHGMIPITTKENGMEQYAEYCYFFEDYHIENIEQKISEMLMNDMETLQKKAESIFEFSNRRFTLGRFGDDMSKVLKDIM